MEIREAEKSDISQLTNLVSSLTSNFLDDPRGDAPFWLATTITHEAFQSRILSGEYLNYVYEEFNCIIGYISIKRNGHLYHLFVSKKSQGKGIARKLWEHAKLQCKCARYFLRASRNAIPVYTHFGFTPTGPIETRDGVSFQPMEYNTKHDVTG